MATLYIDNRPYTVAAEDNLLQACLSLGLDLPYFCWHPALGSVGACRQCAVKQFKDEHDAQGKIVMACMTPAADGTRISLDDGEARTFRASVIEWLMTNHPHDCPVCEEGGECHLQDMTHMTGHVYRRTRFPKRTFRNQDLGPCLNHEMNRCITCYRCVRFYQDYAGGHDLQALAMHNHVYFGRERDGVLESEFSGNLAEVCPTGVFTDRPFGAHYTRKWDLRAAPAVCVHCAVGCNTSPGERYGRLRRIVNRYNGAVNGYFLCDRGRFGYDFVNGPQRLRQALVREASGAEARPVPAARAVQHLAGLLAGGAPVIGIGSPRASLEANFALRTLVGPERFYRGVATRDDALVTAMLDILRRGPARTPSLREVEQCDAVLILGEDPTHTAPRLALSLRQCVRHRSLATADELGIPRWQDAAVRGLARGIGSPLFVAAPRTTGLDDVATLTLHAAPDDLARLGFAVANALDADAPAVPDVPPDRQDAVQAIARALGDAKRPLVVSGSGAGSPAVVQAAAQVAWALCGKDRQARLCYTLPECNSLGLALMGGGTLAEAFAALKGEGTTLVVLENDLYRRAPRAAVDAALERAAHVVVLDHLVHGTCARAELALPAGTFAESDGTLVSAEGRAQRSFRVMPPEGEVRESWRWLNDVLAQASGGEAPWANLDALTGACAAALPALAPITAAAPGARFRIVGQKIPREPPRASGRTAMLANVTVHEPKPPQDPDSPLSYTMEGHYGDLPGALIPFFWAPAWNSVQSVNKFQAQVGGPLRGGDPGVRLIEPDGAARPAWLTSLPASFVPRAGEYLVLPLHHIFASEELSARADALKQRSPGLTLTLNPDDAARSRVGEGEALELRVAQTVVRAAALLSAAQPPGTVGLVVGAPETDWVDLPGWGTWRRVIS